MKNKTGQIRAPIRQQKVNYIAEKKDSNTSAQVISSASRSFTANTTGGSLEIIWILAHEFASPQQINGKKNLTQFQFLKLRTKIRPFTGQYSSPASACTKRFSPKTRFPVVYQTLSNINRAVLCLCDESFPPTS
jgi:hypothetical protein